MPVARLDGLDWAAYRAANKLRQRAKRLVAQWRRESTSGLWSFGIQNCYCLCARELERLLK